MRHAHFGSGGVMGYDGDGYMIIFRGGETRVREVIHRPGRPT